MHKKDLIENSNIILHAKLKASYSDENSLAVIYQFDVLEVLKGKTIDKWIHRTSKAEPQTRHFNDHTDQSFWEEHSDRTYYSTNGGSPGIIFPISQLPLILQIGCQRHHYSFELGTDYLLFPGTMGSMNSAEIIRTNNDDWLKFVRANLRHQQ